MNTKPNIIVLIVDAFRYDHTNFSNYFRDTTPFLSQCASDAFLFTHTFTNSTKSGLSLASMTTSSYAFEYKSPVEIKPPRIPLSELLHQVGYYTALTSSNPYYEEEFGYHRGVDFYKMLFNRKEELKRIAEKGFFVRAFKTASKNTLYQNLKEFLKKKARKLYEVGRIGKTVLTTRKNSFGAADLVNGAIFAALKNYKQSQPIFLWAHYMDLHAPNLPPRNFLKKFGRNIPKYQQLLSWKKRSITPPPTFSQEEIDDMILLYDACLAYIDESIKEVISELKRLNIYDNSLIIITGDHGEAFGEHGDIGHHGHYDFLYDEYLHVPLLIKFPGNEKGLCHEIVSLIDIAPTILDLADVAFPSFFRGTSLKPLLNNRELDLPQVETFSGKENYIIAFAAPKLSPRAFKDIDFNKPSFAIRTKNWKLIVGPCNREELYDLNRDHQERINLLQSSEKKDRIYDLRSKLYDKLKPYLLTLRDLQKL